MLEADACWQLAEKPPTNSKTLTPELCLACLVPPAIPPLPQRIDCPLTPKRGAKGQLQGPETKTPPDVQASSAAINATPRAKTTVGLTHPPAGAVKDIRSLGV